MASICLYFHVHQPKRLKPYSVFDFGNGDDYFTNSPEPRLDNVAILNKVAQKSYLPANRTFLELLRKYPELKLSFSISGVLIEQLEEYAPDVLDSFKRLVDTGRVELLAETYYHSLAFLHSDAEFKEQIKLHMDKIRQTFGVTPQMFRNTELIYKNEIADIVSELGMKGVLTEGADHILDWRSPNFVYQAAGRKMPLMLKNYRLSDDIAFRFSEQGWSEYPLSAEKFANWLSKVNGNGEVVNLFMDYETFGEHQWAETGIFKFLQELPGELLKHPDNDFITASEGVERYQAKGELDIPFYISWADVERDLSAWYSNDMQRSALAAIFRLEDEVKQKGSEELLHVWRLLQTSDHFYYMCTKWFNDGDVHKYFSPYETPHQAFVNFMTVVGDLRGRVL